MNTSPQADSSFLLHWTGDEWRNSTDTLSHTTGVGIEFVDIPVSAKEAILNFTFFWLEENRWEGKDYAVTVRTSG